MAYNFNTDIIQARADFSKLEMSTLNRYKRKYKLKPPRNNPTPTKEELAMLVSKHFANIPIEDEIEIIETFLETINSVGTQLRTFRILRSSSIWQIN